MLIICLFFGRFGVKNFSRYSSFWIDIKSGFRGDIRDDQCYLVYKRINAGRCSILMRRASPFHKGKLQANAGVSPASKHIQVAALMSWYPANNVNERSKMTFSFLLSFFPFLDSFFLLYICVWFNLNFTSVLNSHFFLTMCSFIYQYFYSFFHTSHLSDLTPWIIFSIYTFYLIPYLFFISYLINDSLTLTLKTSVLYIFTTWCFR